MKKVKHIFSTAALLFTLGLCMLFASPVQAKSNPTKVSLQPGRIYRRYDITGNGKRDKIQIKTTPTTDSDGSISDFSIYVNGKKAYTLNSIRNFYKEDVCAQLYTLSNGKPFLYLYVAFENGDGPVCGIFQYKGRRLNEIIDFQETLETYGYHQMGYVTGVSGNRLYVSQELNSYSLGLNSIRFVYKYSRGTLVPASKYGSYTSIYTLNGRSRYLTANRDIPVYTTAYANASLKFNILKGDRVRINKCALIKSKMYIQISSKGMTGWILPATSYPETAEYQQFTETQYAG